MQIAGQSYHGAEVPKVNRKPALAIVAAQPLTL